MSDTRDAIVYGGLACVLALVFLGIAYGDRILLAGCLLLLALVIFSFVTDDDDPLDWRDIYERDLDDQDRW